MPLNAKFCQHFLNPNHIKQQRLRVRVQRKPERFQQQFPRAITHGEIIGRPDFGDIVVYF